MHLEAIVAQYDALVVDLWGVIHDGGTLYPGVADTLHLLHRSHQPVLFLSNAPRVASKARLTLERLGIPRAQYLDVITSGQVAHDQLAATHAFASKSSGAEAREPVAYYYLGPGKDEDILGDLQQYFASDDAGQARFILCTGYEVDGQPHEEIIPLLTQLLHLPMLCVNPDMEVVTQNGERMLCAGAVAAEFHRMGGRVSYVGKPFPEVYEVCKAKLGGRRILCVGDNPITDIKGANDAGLDSLLVTSGVLKARYGDAITEADAHEVCRIAGVTPTYVLPKFAA